MFFAVAAYTTGIALKLTALPFWAVILLVIAAAILQAILFSLVLNRVKGVTFTLVSLGLASMVHIIVVSSDMVKFTGADVGLQGVIVPAFMNPATERLRFYVIAAVLLVAIYLFYKRFVNSPTGRVCVAIRENEARAKMLGFNTATFKFVVMIISSLTASVAGVLHCPLPAHHQPQRGRSQLHGGWIVDGVDRRGGDPERRGRGRFCAPPVGFLSEAVYR